MSARGNAGAARIFYSLSSMPSGNARSGSRESRCNVGGDGAPITFYQKALRSHSAPKQQSTVYDDKGTNCGFQSTFFAFFRTKLMKQLFTLFLIVCSCLSVAHGQTLGIGKTQQLLWTYELPSNLSRGPSDILVKGEYYFEKYSLGDKYYVRLVCRIHSIEHQAKFGTLRYRLNGKDYRQDQMHATDGLGMQGFSQLHITSMLASMEVNFLENPKEGNIGDGIAYNVGETSRNSELSKLMLNLAASRLKRLNWEGSQALESRIYNLDKPKIVQPPKQAPALNATKPSSSNRSLPSLTATSSGSKSSGTSQSGSGSGSSSSRSSGSSSSSSSASKSSGSSTSAPQGSFTQAELEAFQRANRPKEEIMAENFVNMYNAASALADEISANRERKAAARARQQASAEAAYNRFLSNARASENSYLRSVDDYNNQLKNPMYMRANIVSKIARVMKAPTIGWDIFLANKAYVNFFGKDIKYIDKKLQVGYNIRDYMTAGSESRFNGISPQFQKIANVKEEPVFYWYNNEYLEHYDVSILLNENNIMTGLEIQLDTRNYQRPKSITQYVADLKVALANDAVQISGNTFLTKDRLYVLDFGFLRMYDLRFFRPDTHFTLFSEAVRSAYGMVLNGEPDNDRDPGGSKVVVSDVLPGSIAASAGLLRGDVIMKIDNQPVARPYEIEMYFSGDLPLSGVELIIERGRKTQRVTITNNK
ncbi:MAG: PDZ domain-containing protein [Chitinophagaceae bacterium]|nr:MAG: PDZ domain-containing protein [Chitinophagaceae bacterium]